MKNIVICADGTGNKGGYGADTNVYKIYKAVNIHGAKKGLGSGLEQVTFYDQGVGTDKSDTNKNKYWTALSGAFGFGFKNNILDLYRFLIRSYNPGDSVFLFGFSRGAATVRAFAGLIHHCGLIDRNNPNVPIHDDIQFEKLLEEAMVCYEKKGDKAAKFKEKYALKDSLYAPDGHLKIKFIGVWDTVSALGFPKDFSKAFEWFFNFWDRASDIVWPHRFYDYELNPYIEHAYHAISIDDERKTFHPLIWDESKTKGHVEQVWFSGVHSNVGGGYPRTGLSDIALEWMISKAEAHGLVFYNWHKQQISASVNKNDRLYDSRDGIAIYYRYGPRDLTVLCKNKLRGNMAIHTSAYQKILDTSDPYAPDGLPATFNVVDINPNNAAGSMTLRTISVDKKNTSWDQLESEMKGYIKWRERLYRWFVELTLAIVIVAGWMWEATFKAVKWLSEFLADFLKISESILTTWESCLASWEAFIKQISTHSECSLEIVAAPLKYITPVYFENFITYVVCMYPWIFVTMIAILYIMNRLRKFFTNKLGNVCGKLCDLLK